ncbi:MAG: hypothetical protein AB8G16_01185 [Gammaproteobacteria bacterium]
MTDPRNHTDTAETLAALLAQTGTAHGETPAPEELRAWAARTLEPARRAEIDSYIAHDPVVFERAMRYVDEAKDAPARARPMLALAATVLVAFAGATFFFMNPTSPERSIPAGVERSARAPISDWRDVAFRAGVERSTAFEALNLNLTTCVDGDRCPELARTLYTYGGALAKLSAACRNNVPPSADALAAFADTQRTFRNSFELAPWSEPLEVALASATPDCGAVNALLEAPTGAQ